MVRRARQDSIERGRAGSLLYSSIPPKSTWVPPPAAAAGTLPRVGAPCTASSIQHGAHTRWHTHTVPSTPLTNILPFPPTRPPAYLIDMPGHQELPCFLLALGFPGPPPAACSPPSSHAARFRTPGEALAPPGDASAAPPLLRTPCRWPCVGSREPALDVCRAAAAAACAGAAAEPGLGPLPLGPLRLNMLAWKASNSSSVGGARPFCQAE